ncbi:Nucleoid occlusion factor SlmA [Rhizobium rhizogenes]|uniref:Nucleoid occlusion factor SlmA n=1 Tax=Rhizobium rhizogenes TaxID=359 RepID=A0AAN2A9P9_RHIRH|nr:MULTISPECIES: TetR/AcrR family transcriptional regulator [Rhizobium/Agrobacterium group]AQS63889.1 TetR/AcrR family transcriptional regulator [Rhizobium rhizogenes]MCZ7444864.1 TetR/AcrR family transcriptional regulator [Rhizobium rhizogenes]NSZ81825.1 TetR/AcrR family transcriptional regulator [Agrobacterium tumefaciens]OAM61870.1 hypothetical protein A8L48_05790 [Rhizobium rhizogenes]CAD0216133.1 Nucleoid occlusion factor SlmA [Rhizobium rhizogenes]
MAADNQGLVSVRKKPSQARARHTVGIILEASAQILRKEGETALTTNRIAEKAGFSIGTLYQYFPNRDAILQNLVERERESSEMRIRAALGRVAPGAPAETVRQVVRILIESFTRHSRMRKSFTLIIMRLATARGVPTRLDSVAGLIVETWRNSVDNDAVLTETEVFILTRAVLGALRAAILEETNLLGTAAFEDALVRLIMGFLGNGEASHRDGVHAG